ncbi:LOW QUALITY PROTEIN: U3 small nucleolar RNA-associated protein 14 homolog A [Thamnophis elegans]|uniref:LOW QUALITY PROTEIN: U3 small nucleolar RNA-associated protein 14 homolog A n=1 Tax=Thamnophis elegans TaxID=35005 RepID=UPI00137866CB|nr:LOW QUALITY PROTEIN: U3 small nucleolar RNA-associated protein 14 homolog A [Thamnophis elegans]
MEAMEEEDPSERELIPSEEEDEVEEVDEEGAAKKHRQLVDALTALVGGKRRRKVERTEASAQISEFDVGGGGAGEKVQLSELLQPVSAVPALRPVQKQLKKAQQKKPTEIPLSKEETERVVREAAYTQTAEALNKWDPVVKQNRRAEQLIFPLQQESVSIAPIEEVISGWQARTPLEHEIFSLLHKAQQPVKDPLLTPQEKVSLKAMSLEEAKLRRMELQRARALQSYYEAKARRQGKIKSKKFHKMVRKGKSRKVLQEFETLRKCNPEAALEQLEKIEKARIEERMSLKHQNKGRWAKSTVLMAKYDLQARQAMQEQLAQNKELTKKVPPASESEEEDVGDNPEAEKDLVPDVVNERHLGMASNNPWMLGKSPAESKEKPSLPAEDSEESEEEGEEPLMANEKDPSQGSDGQWQSLKCLQEPGHGEVPPEAPPSPPSGEQPFLSEKLKRIRTLEDLEESLEPEDVPQEDEMLEPKETQPAQSVGADSLPQPQISKSKKSAKQQTLIDLKAVLAGEPLATQCPLVPAAVQDELESGTSQRQMIQEAFASDNVLDDFLKEKRAAEEAGKPKAIDLVLPGWGEWGGVGLHPSKKKKKRFLIKPAPGPPRKDRHLPHVLLNERRNVLAAAHQVNQLPFPFESTQQFERSIQVPVGSTWNTRRTFQQLTAPRVITQPGQIIRPITAEDTNLIHQKDRSAAGAKPRFGVNPPSPPTSAPRIPKKKGW